MKNNKYYKNYSKVLGFLDILCSNFLLFDQLLLKKWLIKKQLLNIHLGLQVMHSLRM